MTTCMSRSNLIDVFPLRKMHKLRDIRILESQKVSQLLRRRFIAVKIERSEPVCVSPPKTETGWEVSTYPLGTFGAQRKFCVGYRSGFFRA